MALYHLRSFATFRGYVYNVPLATHRVNTFCEFSLDYHHVS
nr:MAG TPA: hypothetical protein [Caudoviricetes sp.]